MAYDEHGENSNAGSDRLDPLVSRRRAARVRSIPREKLVVGIANYAYDWTEGGEWAEPITYQGALILAQDYRQVRSRKTSSTSIDESLNPTFCYIDDEGKSMRSGCSTPSPRRTSG